MAHKRPSVEEVVGLWDDNNDGLIPDGDLAVLLDACREHMKMKPLLARYEAALRRIVDESPCPCDDGHTSFCAWNIARAALPQNGETR